MDGAKARGINEKKAAKIFDLMEYFAGYGFNKSHSTAYALLAYQTAYLKANYPWHFAAALLTIESQNTDKLALYLGECRERGIPVLPPDVNESQLAFTVTPEGVRFGLTADQERRRGRDRVACSTCAERTGRITSLHALCEDLDLRLVNKRVLESLVKAGAFDSLGGPGRSGAPASAALRARLMARHRRRLRARRPAAARPEPRAGAAVRRRRGGRRGDQAGDPIGLSRHRCRTRRRGPRRSSSRTRRRRSGSTGAAIRSIASRPTSRRFGARTTADLAAEARSSGPEEGGGRRASRPERRTDVAVGGIVAACRQLKTRKGDRMAVFTLEDAHGSVEVVVFPETYAKAAPP